MDSEYVTPSLTEDMKKIATQYVSGLQVGRAVGCCTDSLGFYDEGM
jgi:hypothetical protein